MKFSRSYLLGCVLSLCFGTLTAWADVTLTPATGGNAITADSTGGSFTAVTGPVLTENATGDIGTGTIVLNCPAGFEFDSSATVTVAVTGTGTGNDVVLASGTAVVTSSTITITVTSASDTGATSTLTWSGITMRPTAGTPLASGTITESGSAVFTLDAVPAEDYGALTEVAGAATQLAFTTQPGSATAGSIFGTQPSVVTRDQFGNASANGLGTDLDLTLTLSSGTGALLGSTTLDIGTSAGNGTANFSDLEIDSAGTGKQLTASASGLTGATSSAFAVAHAGASQLIILSQPAPFARAGEAFTNQPIVEVADDFGNCIVEDNSSQVSASLHASVDVPQGTLTMTVSNGVATFTNISYNVIGDISLDFSSDPLNGATSDDIEVSPGASADLVINTEPSTTAAAAVAFAQQPVVFVMDAYGNVNTNDNSTVVTVTQSGGADLLGTTNMTAVAGVVTFTNLAETTATSITLSFTSGSFTPDTSTSIDVAAGPLAQLSITMQPSSTGTAGSAFAQQPVVTMYDAYGNLLANDNSTVVTAMAIGTSSPLDGTTAVSASAGVVTYSDLGFSSTGTFHIRFSAGAVTVNSDDITYAGGSAAQIAFVTEPTSERAGHPFGTQPVIKVLDDHGNIAGDLPDSLPITITLAGGDGYLFGQTTIDAGALAGAGVATFTNLEINTAGTDKTLAATADGFDDVTSDTFTTVGTAQPFKDFADYSAGGTPNSIWVGNFRAAITARDLVVANHDDKTFNVRLSDDRGGFGTPVTYSLPAHPVAVRAMDLNGDGYDDLVVAYDDTNIVTVLLSSGSHGTAFTSAGSYTISDDSNPGVSAIFLTELNGDGHPDLIVANSFDDNISVLYGTAGGGFGSLTNYSVGANPQWIHVADIDQDGKQDIVTANFDDGTISVLFGQTKTNFLDAQTVTPFPGGNPQPIRVITPDVNRDGLLDLAVVNYASNSVSILLYNTNGTFTLSTNYSVGTHPSDFFLRDLNGDGISDLAVLNSGSGTVDLLLNSGTGHYNAAGTIPVGPGPVSLFGGKFHQSMAMNGLVVADTVSSNVSVLLYSVPRAHNATNTVNQDQPLDIELSATSPAFSDTYNYTITQYPTNGTLSGTPPDVTYTPNLYYLGKDAFKFTADFNGTTSTVATVTLNVVAINHAPTFTMATNNIVLMQGASENYPSFIGSQSPGAPPNESTQKIDYIVSVDNPILFSTQPKITNGILSFKLSASTNGTAHLTVYAHDNGGTARGGTNISDGQVLTVVETRHDQAPTVKPIPAISVLENSSGSFQITAKDLDDSITNITVTPTSLNEAIVPTANILVSGPTGSNFVVSVTPAANTYGTATIHLAVSDGILTTNASATVNVVHVNQAPSFTIPNTNVTVLEDSATTVLPGFCTSISAGPTNEATQTVAFVIENTNSSAFMVQPTVGARGTLRFRPMPGYVGTNYISTYLKDNGGTTNGGVNVSAAKTFCIAVTTNNFRHLAGTYNGLFHEAAQIRHNSSGLFKMTLGFRRGYSGQVTIEGGTYSMSGAFDTNGFAHPIISRMNKRPLFVTLQVNLTNDDDQVTGTFSDLIWTADLVADRQFGSVPSGTAGTYNVAFVGYGDGVTSPAGDAIGVVKVYSTNLLTFSGFLPTKAPIAQSVAISKNGQWPFYVSLFGGAGSMMGWLTVTNDVNPIQANAVSWIKVFNNVGYYPGGFTNELTVQSSPSTTFVTGTPVVSTNGTITCLGANLVTPLISTYALTPNNTFVTDSSTNHFKLTFDQTKGYLTGSFINPITRTTNTVRGLLLPNANQVRGYFDTPSQTGELLLQGN